LPMVLAYAFGSLHETGLPSGSNSQSTGLPLKQMLFL
jgi:hypothetical protein